VLGIVYDVTRDLMYCSARGEGCWVGNRRLTALTTPLNDASILMMTSNCIDASGRCPEYARRWMGQTNWKLRMIGSAALEATQVAAGIAHGAVTINGKLWDIAAPAALVLEAGGLVTDLKGKPIFPIDLTNYIGAKVPFLAAGPGAQDELLREIRMYP
jgi:myo-inositol-1(or 4)-monophosphatase